MYVYEVNQTVLSHEAICAQNPLYIRGIYSIVIAFYFYVTQQSYCNLHCIICVMNNSHIFRIKNSKQFSYVDFFTYPKYQAVEPKKQYERSSVDLTMPPQTSKVLSDSIYQKYLKGLFSFPLEVRYFLP